MIASPRTPSILRVLMLSYGSATGKSSLISRFVNGSFSEEYNPTTGDIQSRTMTVDGESVVIQILDTPGDPQLFEVAAESMKFADMFMVVYDSSEQNVMSCLPLRFSIMQEKQTTSPAMILVGTKSDLRQPGRKSSGLALAESWECPFIETSARDNINVEEAFIQLVREHRARRRTFVHERKVSAFFSNAFPRLRAWDSTETFGRVIKSGWLHKRGLLRQNWKFRHVVIYDDGSFQYFSEEGDTNPLGELNLKDVLQVVDHHETGHEDAFILQTKERDWYFSCLSPDEKDGWLDVITRLMADFAARHNCQEKENSNDGFEIPSEADYLFEKRLSLSPSPSNSSFGTNTSSTMLSPRTSLSCPVGMVTITE